MKLGMGQLLVNLTADSVELCIIDVVLTLEAVHCTVGELYGYGEGGRGGREGGRKGGRREGGGEGEWEEERREGEGGIKQSIMRPQ